jgi:hypothetical protein
MAIPLHKFMFIQRQQCKMAVNKEYPLHELYPNCYFVGGFNRKLYGDIFSIQMKKICMKQLH